MKNKKKWMRPSRYAKMKRVSPQVVNNWVKRGKLLRKQDENGTVLVTAA